VSGASSDATRFLESRVSSAERRNFAVIANGASEKPACVTLNQAIPRLPSSFRAFPRDGC